MANEITLDFGSLDLEANDINVRSIKVKEKKSSRVHDIPKSDGSIAETGRRKSLVLTVEGDIVGSGYDDLRTNLDALKAGLQNGIQSFTTDDDRYVKGQLRDFDYSYLTLRRMAKWRASFDCHYPFWLADTATVDDRTPTSGAGYTVTNNGNAEARCKVEITASGGAVADDCAIANTTNDKGFRFTGTIADTKALEIDNRYDTDDFEVLNDGADAHTGFEGDFLTLSPGANTIVFTGLASTDVKITFKDTYY